MLKFNFKITIVSLSISYIGCYYNPVVNNLLSPTENDTKTVTNTFLTVAGFSTLTTSTATMRALGQIKDLDGNFIKNPKVSIAPGNTSTKNFALSNFATGYVNGKFLLYLSPGTFRLDIRSVEGTLLGSIDLFVASDQSLSFTVGADASFSVVNFIGYGLNEELDLGDITEPILASSVPSNGESEVTLLSSYLDVICIFNKEMDSSTISIQTVVLAPGTSSSYSVTSSGKQIQITINDPYQLTLQEISFKKAIKDLNGISITPFSIQFTTGPAS